MSKEAAHGQFALDPVLVCAYSVQCLLFQIGKWGRSPAGGGFTGASAHGEATSCGAPTRSKYGRNIPKIDPLRGRAT